MRRIATSASTTSFDGLEGRNPYQNVGSCCGARTPPIQDRSTVRAFDSDHEISSVVSGAIDPELFVEIKHRGMHGDGATMSTLVVLDGRGGMFSAPYDIVIKRQSRGLTFQ